MKSMVVSNLNVILVRPLFFMLLAAFSAGPQFPGGADSGLVSVAEDARAGIGQWSAGLLRSVGGFAS